MYLFPCSLLYSPQYLDLVPTRSIISGMLLANIACKQNGTDPIKLWCVKRAGVCVVQVWLVSNIDGFFFWKQRATTKLREHQRNFRHIQLLKANRKKVICEACIVHHVACYLVPSTCPQYTGTHHLHRFETSYGRISMRQRGALGIRELLMWRARLCFRKPWALEPKGFYQRSQCPR